MRSSGKFCRCLDLFGQGREAQASTRLLCAMLQLRRTTEPLPVQCPVRPPVMKPAVSVEVHLARVDIRVRIITNHRGDFVVPYRFTLSTLKFYPHRIEIVRNDIPGPRRMLGLSLAGGIFESRYYSIRRALSSTGTV